MGNVLNGRIFCSCSNNVEHDVLIRKGVDVTLRRDGRDTTLPHFSTRSNKSRLTHSPLHFADYEGTLPIRREAALTNGIVPIQPKIDHIQNTEESRQ